MPHTYTIAGNAGLCQINNTPDGVLHRSGRQACTGVSLGVGQRTGAVGTKADHAVARKGGRQGAAVFFFLAQRGRGGGGGDQTPTPLGRTQGCLVGSGSGGGDTTCTFKTRDSKIFWCACCRFLTCFSSFKSPVTTPGLLKVFRFRQDVEPGLWTSGHLMMAPFAQTRENKYNSRHSKYVKNVGMQEGWAGVVGPTPGRWRD